MFKGVDFEEFFSRASEYLSSDEEIIAGSVITPVQTVHARLTSEGKRLNESEDKYEVLHDDIFYYVLGEIFGIGRDIDTRDQAGRDEKKMAIGVVIDNREENFVTARYVISKILFCAIIEAPAFITNYQMNELIKLNERLKAFGFDIGVTISNYNPVIVKKDHSMDYKVFEDNQNISLDLAIDFLSKNGRIVDYDLPFGEEHVLEVKGKEKSI